MRYRSYLFSGFIAIVISSSPIRSEANEEFEKEEAIRYNQKALEHFRAGRLDQALASAERSLGQCNRIRNENDRTICQSLGHFSVFGIRMGFARNLTDSVLFPAALIQFAKAMESCRLTVVPKERDSCRKDYYSNLLTAREKMGDHALSVGAYREALVHFEEAEGIAIGIDAPNPKQAALMAAYVSAVLKNLGEYRKAIVVAERAISRARRIAGEELLQGIALHIQAESSRSLAEYDGALRLDHAASALFAADPVDFNFRRYLALTQNSIGETHLQLGHFDLAIENQSAALRILTELPSREILHELATVQTALGETYVEVGETLKGIELHNQALKNLDAMGLQADPLLRAGVLNNLGKAFVANGAYWRAQEYFIISKKVLASLPDGLLLPAAAVLNNNQGMAYWASRNLTDASTAFKEAERLSLKSGDSRMLLFCYNNMGLVFSEIGNEGQALENFKNARLIADRIQIDASMKATIHNNIGNLQRQRGQWRDAILSFDKAFSIYEKSSQKGGNRLSILILNNLAVAHISVGNPKVAIQILEKALRIFNAKPDEQLDRSLELDLYLNSGLAYSQAGNQVAASNAYETSIRKLRDLRFYFSQPDKTLLTTRFNPAFNHAIEHALSQNHTERAFMLEMQRKGLSVVERVSLVGVLSRAGVPEIEAHKVLALQKETENIQTRVHVLTAQGKVTEADRLRAIALAREEQGDRLLTGLQERFGELRHQLTSEPPTVTSLQRSMKEEEEIILSYNFAGRKPRVFALSKVNNVQVVELTSDAASIDRKVRNLYTLISQPRTHRFILVVNTDRGEILWNVQDEPSRFQVDKDLVFSVSPSGSVPVKAPRSKGRLIGKRLPNPLTIAEMEKKREELTQELSNTVITSVVSRMPKGKTANIVIIPDGPLNYLPVGVLTSKPEFSPEISGVSLQVVHSAMTWYALRHKPKVSYELPLLAFGNAVYAPGWSASVSNARETRSEESRWANLPGTNVEINAIGEITYPDPIKRRESVKTGFEASVEKVMQLNRSGAFRRYRVVHFSTHGYFREGNPELNAIVLTIPDQLKVNLETDAVLRSEYERYQRENGSLEADGFLRMGDVAALDMNSELVVLASCQTSLGNETAGEGLLALHQAFIRAGARAVLATLWSVSDRPSQTFMKIYYSNLFEKKMNPREALKTTQEQFVAENPGWADPYFWAAFVLHGD